MAEHDHDRMDEAQDAVKERKIVRDGGIARSDSDIEDVTRDTHGVPVAPDRGDDHTADDDRTRAREVLGIARDVTPDPDFAVGDDSGRRRRGDDVMEDPVDSDSSGSSYQGPDGLKVRG